VPPVVAGQLCGGAGFVAWLILKICRDTTVRGYRAAFGESGWVVAMGGIRAASGGKRSLGEWAISVTGSLVPVQCVFLA